MFYRTIAILCVIALNCLIQANCEERGQIENATKLDYIGGAFDDEYDSYNSLDQLDTTSSLQKALASLNVNVNPSSFPPPRSGNGASPKIKPNSTITTGVPPTQRKERQSQSQLNFGKNITFHNENITVKYYGVILKEQIPPHQRLQYFDALSDSMRAESRFQNEEDLQEFAQLFYWLLDQNYQSKINSTIQNQSQYKNQSQNETSSTSSPSNSSSSTTNNKIDSGNNSSTNPPTAWIKKFERKNLKRLLKYALNSDSESLNPNEEPFLNFKIKNATLPSSRQSQSTELHPPPPCTKQNRVKWLAKEFYERLLAHTESEGYEILSEAIELRNLTLTPDQLLAIQCLYYNSFQGMQDDRAYIFADFELDWDLRNTIFGTPIILSSIRHMVQSILNEDDASEPRMSDDMVQILSVFPSFRAKVEAEKKRKAVKYPTPFYKAVRKLQTKFYGIKKSNNFVDVDSHDIILSTGVSSLLESTGDLKKPNTTLVVFSFDNRLDWSHLQLLRLAGTQTFEKFNEFYTKLVVDKITDVYKTGNGIRRYVKQFANTFSRIRMLPTGPLILVGCETLNTLMTEDPPVDRNSVSSASQIKKFKQLLQFLRGLYSQDEILISELPQQVQLLTDPTLNKNLKLMLKYSISNKANNGNQNQNETNDDVNFAEIGIVQQTQKSPQEGGVEAEERSSPTDLLQTENTIAIVPLESVGKYQNMTNYKNIWQFQLGYFRGYAETWQDPVIKMNILLSGQTTGELHIGRRSGELIYNSNSEHFDTKNISDVLGATDLIADGSSSFWDLFLFPDGQSFQLKWQGGLERFFSVEFDPSGQVPVKLKATHFVSGEVPRDFKPAEFFVVPADDYF